MAERVYFEKGPFRYWRNEEKDTWYWDLKDVNGRIVADGSESYVSKSNIERAIDNVTDLIYQYSIEEIAAIKALGHEVRQPTHTPTPQSDPE